MIISYKGDDFMETDKLQEILSDENFVREILEMKTAEEVQKAFEEKSIKLTIAEIQLLGSEINEQIKKIQDSEENKIILDSELENISGGSNSLKKQFMEGYTSGTLGPAYAYSEANPNTRPTTKKERFSRYAGIAIGTGMAACSLGISWGVGTGVTVKNKISKK